MRTWRFLMLVALAGCTARNPNLIEFPEGGVDLALLPDSRDLALPADLAPFTPALHRDFPQLVHASTGGMLSPLRLVVITAAGDPMADALAAFGDAAVKSSWFSTVTAEYGGVPPSESLHLSGLSFPPGTAPLDATAVAVYVQQTLLAATNPPAPDGRTLYLVYLPPGVDLVGNMGCQLGASGYHDRYGTVGDGAAVVQRCQGSYETMMQMLTILGSHEIAAAATDTGLGWRVAIPPATTPPWMADPWLAYNANHHTEDAALCVGTRIFEQSYYFQRAFSNAAAGAGGDPCVPSLSRAYFGATTDKPWYSASAGATLQIPVTGWSTASTADWIVHVSVQNTSDWTLPWKPATGGATLNNGTTATLKVTIPATAPSGAWVALNLIALRQDANKNPLPGEDYRHLQMVGVWVP
jgi:hypothetical protein